MSGWLNQLAERSKAVDSLSALTTDKRGFVVLDQRRSPEQCRPLLGLSGKQDFLTLFAGTSPSPLIEASPWLVEIDQGSEAWHYAEALCQKRLGWMCLPSSDQTLQSIANHLRTLFVLDDPHGGKSLINLQQPAVCMALLASVAFNAYSYWLSLFQLVATPTPQGQWLVWQPLAATPAVLDEWQLTTEMEVALKESQQAWWLSEHSSEGLTTLPYQWVERLSVCVNTGITKGRYLIRLLPIIQQADEAAWQRVEQLLSESELVGIQRIKAVEKLHDGQ
ncbi:DUF4123 domain-containing protein [Vreelandella sulfidaeris]|uniref:DUF4123 domain-containing protein n=1 Tax=Vreelandella sulfidaeris TaxID=115553 RepID=UPI0035EF8CC3